VSIVTSGTVAAQKLRTSAEAKGRTLRVQRMPALPSTAVYRTGSSTGSDRMTGRSITGSIRSAASARFSAKRAASTAVIWYRAWILG
jgi:hypothetical protein